jgi:mRNA-degrading endonuclease RelE of RelBE toxin-antitoxin system
MADEIKKFLVKVSLPERLLIKNLIKKIVNNNLQGLQIKKLVGSTDIFRIRKGKFRIIYKRMKSDYIIMSIERRSEKTYKNF